MKRGVAASYKLGALGYAGGMIFSVVGDVTAALLFIAAAAVVATALFISSLQT